MKSMVFLVSFVFLILISSLGLAYGPQYSQYDLDVLYSLIENKVEIGFRTDWVDIQKLNQDDDEEFVIISIRKEDTEVKEHTDFSYLNQIIVLKHINEELEVVWKSELFKGDIIDLNSDDIDNNGNLNINVVYSVDETGVQYLYSYDWLAEQTKKVYPSEGLPVLTTSGFYRFVYWKDKHTIVLTTILQEKPFKQKEEIYFLKNGQLTLENVYITPDEEPVVESSPQPTLADSYPEINQIVQEHCNGILLEIYDLSYKNLSLVEIDPADAEESRFFLIESVDDKPTFLYKLGKEYNSMILCELETNDINGDGYLDLIMVEGYTYDFEINLYYIVSLLPRGPRLISPVTDWFTLEGIYESQMFMFADCGPIVVVDIDDDGIPEVGSSMEYADTIATLYWNWDGSLGTYVPYKIEYVDELTGENYLIDFESVFNE